MGGHQKPKRNLVTPAALLASVREATPASCQSSGCSKPGCSLPVARSLRPFVLIDLDAEGSPAEPNEARCDFLFFGAAGEAEALWFAPIELKKGSPNAFEVRDQLQAGSEIGDHLLPPDAPVRFQPILGYGGVLRKVQRRRFREQRIHFRAATAVPRRLRCGESLASGFQVPDFDAVSG